MRALSIIEETGRPVSSFSSDNQSNNGHSPLDRNLDFRCVFLTAPRLDLFSRIDRRCEEMMDAGFVEETVK